MTIESVTYISDLDATYPAEGEVGTLHEGNNHLRNIKTGLKNTLPKFSSAVSASPGELNCLIGLSATAGELNILAGAVVTTDELNYLSGLTATAGQLNILDAVTVTAAQLNSPTLMTAQASTSGTAIEFTSIPAWAKRITVMWAGLSTNGTSYPQVQLGDSGGYETSGYVMAHAAITTSSAGAAGATSGFLIRQANAAVASSGMMTLALLDAATNLWVASATFGREGDDSAGYCAGHKALSAALDRLQLTTVNGTDAFDAGTINVMYE